MALANQWHRRLALAKRQPAHRSMKSAAAWLGVWRGVKKENGEMWHGSLAAQRNGYRESNGGVMAKPKAANMAWRRQHRIKSG
jgi:hypothetical protein